MTYDQHLKTAVEAVLEAGELLRTDFHRPNGPRGGGAHAEADEEAERLIRKRLLDAFPEFSYRGEETGSRPGKDPSHIWLVDPNDGTSAYLRGVRGSSVSIGLLKDGVPVLGAVYAFVAPDDRGDLITWAEGGRIQRNGRVVESQWDTADPRQVVILVSAHRESLIEDVQRCVDPYRYIIAPSIAYRLALAACGEGAAAVSWHRPGDWDYAAGHAIVRGAGGVFLNENGDPVVYGPGGVSKTKRCFGGDAKVVKRLWSRDWLAVQHAWEERKPAPKEYFSLARPKAGAVISDPGVLSRAQGCLLGQLAGDALGQQVEFYSPEEIRGYYPEGIRVMEDGGRWGNIAGQITDDSEMALMLARSIAREGGYDREKVAEAYRHWFRKTRPFDYGHTTRVAIGPVTDDDVAAGRAAEVMTGNASASSAESQANGSLMRISPLAIYGCRKSSDELLHLAQQDSSLTHPNQVCGQACGLFVNIIAEAIRTGAGPQALFDSARMLAAARQVAPELLDRMIAAQTTAPDCSSEKIGWVLIAFQNAIYELLHASGPEEGVARTVERGGDTDTNACIAGALLGAVHGREAIPPQWRRMLLSCRPNHLTPTNNKRPFYLWPVDAMILAESLLLAD